MSSKAFFPRMNEIRQTCTYYTLLFIEVFEKLQAKIYWQNAYPWFLRRVRLEGPSRAVENSLMSMLILFKLAITLIYIYSKAYKVA